MSQARILAVVVLYKQTLEESGTVRSMAQSFTAFPELEGSVQVLLWDNSPEPLAQVQTPFPSTYQHSRANVGLARAYNAGARMAQDNGIPWLLLLDQDTRLPAGFLGAMLAQANALNARAEIAAIVPDVYVGTQQVSPVRLLMSRQRFYPPGESGIAAGEATAINSGSLLRVQALLQAGGYSDAFWLDYSDWYVYHQLYLRGLKVWRAAHIRIEHSMTILDYDNLMSPWRYDNFLRAEGAFHDCFRGSLENALQTLRLGARVLRQRRRYKSPEFSHLTRGYLWWRLLKSRRTRVRLWESAAAERQAAYE